MTYTHRGQGDVKMEAEIGVTQLRKADSQQKIKIENEYNYALMEVVILRFFYVEFC